MGDPVACSLGPSSWLVKPVSEPIAENLPTVTVVCQHASMPVRWRAGMLACWQKRKVKDLR